MVGSVASEVVGVVAGTVVGGAVVGGTVVGGTVVGGTVVGGTVVGGTVVGGTMVGGVAAPVAGFSTTPQTVQVWAVVSVAAAPGV